MRLENASFTIFDFETTGLYPYAGDKICEIGAVRISAKTGGIKKFHRLIDPERTVSSGAFNVNGITDDMLKGKPKIDEVMPLFLDFIKDSVLVAYNAGFDLGFLECALGEDREMLSEYLVIDALVLARRLFTEVERYNLSFLSQSLGIKSEGEHRAMSDALMTMKVFKKELKLLEDSGVETVEDIARIRTARPRTPLTVKDYKIKLIEEAIRQEKRLNIVYRSAWSNEVTKRTITPKSIQKGYDKSYVIAHCHLKGAERNFRLDCIVTARRA